MTSPRQHSFAASAGTLCWYEWGHPQSDRPSLLLLHATGFHARVWDRVIAALPPGTHCIAPDLRGHGRSYRPQSLSNWADTALDVAELVASLPAVKLVGVGHSMGGVCLIEVAAALPDHFVSLLLVDPALGAPAVYDHVAMANSTVQEADASNSPIARRRQHWQNVEEMQAHFATREPYRHWHGDILADYCHWGLLPTPDGDGYHLACAPDIEATAYLGFDRHDPYPAIGRITCPVTVLRGRNGERTKPLDFSVSPTFPGLAGHFSHGSDMQWADCSHFIPMEQPGRLAALLSAQIGAMQQG